MPIFVNNTNIGIFRCKIQGGPNDPKRKKKRIKIEKIHV